MTTTEPLYQQVAQMKATMTPSDIMRRLHLSRKQYNNAMRNARDRGVLPSPTASCGHFDGNGRWRAEEPTHFQRETDEQAQAWQRLISEARRSGA